MELRAEGADQRLFASLRNLHSGHAEVELRWQPETSTLAEILDALGRVPLPPYLHRADEPSDREHYQTVYARVPGSVAAPTAGLHFTERLLQRLQHAGIGIVDVCLHVGLDTFKPLRVSDARQHHMHSETLSVPRESIIAMRDFLLSEHRQWFVAVGTTSVRTVESLFWHGVRLLRGESEVWASPTISLPQWEPYRLQQAPLPEPAAALEAVLEWMQRHALAHAEGATELLIMPGYRYGLCDALITNFHQPRSTLLLLIAAFIGDFWRQVYAEALAHGYRFLSYGDASLLICPHSAPH